MAMVEQKIAKDGMERLDKVDLLKTKNTKQVTWKVHSEYA